ncbi:PRC-barrel domain containing protein [Methanosarcina sp. MSH10X1]|nr:PRC-barrel domain containing protein [Methanosarcina sp. MSH10X1]
MADRNDPDFLSEGTLKGNKVVNKTGENIGKIEKLMIDLANGRIAYAVFSFGGILDRGDKLFAIPWQPLTKEVREHSFVLDISREVLEKAKGFDKDSWPLTREELSGIYTYYGHWPYWQTVVAEQTWLRGEAESERMARMGRTTGRKYPDFLPADTIKGQKIVSIAGEDIGKIEELVIDLQAGRVAYAVLSLEGFPDVSGKFFAIPWQALQVKFHEHAFILNIPEFTLEKAEGFDKDNWPVTTFDWLSKVYSYYEYEPYWQTPRL